MKKAILGVTGSVSVYKSVELLRRMQERGWDVTVIPTSSSLNFVGAALWEAISNKPIHTSLWSEVHNSLHLKLAAEAELFIVAPCTANTLSDLASARAHELLAATFLSFTGRKILIPAMHDQMWENQLVQSNVKKLKESGVTVIDPEIGPLASGGFGVGRFPEISKILEKIEALDKLTEKLSGKKFLITNGGTREAIDPVRYLTNRSSGKQGFALAQAALNHGAEVILISTVLPDFSHPNLEVISVESAAQMSEAVKTKHHQIDYSILVAAVSDLRPAEVASEKIKKNNLSKINLIENEDIAAWVGGNRNQGEKILVFAAETSAAGRDNAIAKLEAKGADLIYFNRVDRQIFDSQESEGECLWPDGRSLEITRRSKEAVATALLELI